LSATGERQGARNILRTASDSLDRDIARLSTLPQI
jgi:hypothetical protein